MPWFNSCNKLMLSNTVLRYRSKSVSWVFSPSNLHNNCKNCGAIKISCSPAISIMTVSIYLGQFSSCSRIGISFHSWLVKRRTFTSITSIEKSKLYLVKSTTLHEARPIALITAVRKLSSLIQSLHMKSISAAFS